MITLSNDSMSVLIHPKGAELKSLRNTKSDIEYLWNSDPAFWAKSSPILFPIVGQLKGNTYRFEGREYTLPRHGFARDQDFDAIIVEKEHAALRLSSDDKTRSVYPFDFDLFIGYDLVDTALTITYTVINRTSRRMLFSLGAHPAFNVPLVKSLSYSDYFLEFETTESALRWPITSSGLIGTSPQPFFNSSRLPLSHDLFSNDALVFKNLKSRKISLLTEKDNHGIEFTFHDFPFFGIWAAPNADFVCLEPWCGIADRDDHDQQLVSKEGIEMLGPGESWKRTWTVRTF